MDSSTIIFLFVLITMSIATDGQINRYINPAWLEMDANSEYYPGGVVISQMLQAYGLGDSSRPLRYRSSILDRNDYGRSYLRNRIVNNLNNAYYESDPLTQEYLDRNYDYVDNTIRGSNRYQNNILSVPKRAKINMSSVTPRTTYDPLEYLEHDLPSMFYSGFRSINSDPTVMSQGLVSQRRETARLIPRSTVTPDINEKRIK